ncbi:glycosyltransferase family protein [Stutzerimonas chloritidismutans]|uniref:capsule biosynthesis protein n=1 Tax=Stutzerimonas chloritidismutans TaxID=203192 RepID=UPI003F16E532
MSNETEGSCWRAKAKALDRYRWYLLRERHGPLGSALRFARDALIDWLFGVRAQQLLSPTVVTEPCRFLLLQSSQKVISYRRKQRFMEALRGRGHDLTETALPIAAEILADRKLVRPPEPVPMRYFGYAAYAEWLVERYQPSILLNDRNGSLYSPFLRLSLNRRKRLLVHLAHATTVEASRRLGMNDYDYYFAFGRSSLDALKARRLRFGDTRVVLSGSHMVDQAYDLPAADPTLKALLVLGVGPDKEKQPDFQKTYALLREWSRGNPDYHVMVKLHPRSRGVFWRKAASELDHVEVLSAEVSLAQALARSRVVVNIMSNAVIEAALAGRPVLYVAVGAQKDIFSQAAYFGPRIENIELLSERVRALEPNASALKARAFAEYHLANGIAGLTSTVEHLERLLAGLDVETHFLPHRLPAAGTAPR